MSFATGQPRPANAGRKKGTRNKRTLAADARPDALAHLEKVMTSTDGVITPDLNLRAAIALAQYQYPKPPPTYVAVDGYEEPKTVEEARTLILKLGARLAKGESSRSRRMMLWSPASRPISAIGRPSSRRFSTNSPTSCVTAKILHLVGGRGARRVAGEPPFTGLKELLRPAIVHR